MKKRTLASLSLLILLTIALPTTTHQKALQSQESLPVTTRTGFSEGQFAPNFTLKTMDGQIFKLSDYRGQRILLNFWASWCPPCKSEIPDLNDFYIENKQEKIMVLSVNMTHAEKNTKSIQAFQDMYKIKYPVLLDQSGDIANLYGILTIPTSYLINSNGIIQKRIIGPLQKETIKTLIETLD